MHIDFYHTFLVIMWRLYPYLFETLKNLITMIGWELELVVDLSYVDKFAFGCIVLCENLSFLDFFNLMARKSRQQKHWGWQHRRPCTLNTIHMRLRIRVWNKIACRNCTQWTLAIWPSKTPNQQSSHTILTKIVDFWIFFKNQQFFNQYLGYVGPLFQG